MSKNDTIIMREADESGSILDQSNSFANHDLSMNLKERTMS